jgi:ABC-type transport system substrate-binding protein
VAGFGFGACSQPEGAKPQPVTLHIGLATPKMGAPGTGVRSFVSNLLSEPLVGIGWDGRPVDRVAVVSESEWAPNRLELRLRLRENLKFHDGTPVDLAYFKKFLERILRERQSGTNVSYESVTGVEIDDRNRLVLKLSRPEAFLLTDLANSTLTHPTNPDIGLGAYRLLSHEPNVRMAAFDAYYRGRPSIDLIEIQDFGEQRRSWAALMRGEIDAVHEITPGAVDFVEAEGQTSVRTFPFTRPYFFQLAFNARHPILKQRAVRQALSYAVDRQAIINLALNRQGTVAEGPIWPFHWAYSTAQKTYTHNTEAATLRLDSAGLRMKDATEPGRMPSRLRFRCLTLEKDGRYEKIALVLQKQLYEIGVDMEIQALPGRDLLKRFQSGDFDAVLVERTSGRSLAWTYLSFHSTQTPFGYTAADGVLDRLRSTTAEGEIRTSVSDLQQIFHDDPPAIFIAWPQVARVVNTKFVVPDEKGRDVMSSLWQWKPATPGQ